MFFKIISVCQFTFLLNLLTAVTWTLNRMSEMFSYISYYYYKETEEMRVTSRSSDVSSPSGVKMVSTMNLWRQSTSGRCPPVTGCSITVRTYRQRVSSAWPMIPKNRGIYTPTFEDKGRQGGHDLMSDCDLYLIDWITMALLSARV